MAKEQRAEQLRLPQLLPPARYFGAREHELEIDGLFRPSWNCVGFVDSIPNAGDYFTVEHLGKPLLVQNQGDRVVAFHNICAHRNSLVARVPKGSMPQIKCGYHGWEYDRDGVVCKIPGGEHFKPIRPQEFALDRARTETIGRLIFVTLDSRTPPLKEFFGGTVMDRLAYGFSSSVSHIASWTVNYECNWKVLIENTLEDYHITSVHSATAGTNPPYEQIAHTLDEKYVGYENREPKFANKGSHWLAARMKPDAEFTYFQYIAYPSLIFALGTVSSHLHLLYPTSPTTCRAEISVFLGSGNGGIVGRVLHNLLRWPTVHLSRKFVEEDRLICKDVQHGIENARFEGVLSKREERVHAFQEYVLRNSAERPILRQS